MKRHVNDAAAKEINEDLEKHDQLTQKLSDNTKDACKRHKKQSFLPSSISKSKQVPIAENKTLTNKNKSHFSGKQSYPIKPKNSH